MPRPPRAVKKTVLLGKNSSLKNEKNKNPSSSKKENHDFKSFQNEVSRMDERSNRTKGNISEQSGSKMNESLREFVRIEDLELDDTSSFPLRERHLNASFLTHDYTPQRPKHQEKEFFSTDLDDNEEDPFGFAEAEKKVKSYFKKSNNYSLKRHDANEQSEEHQDPGEFEIIEITQDDSQLIAVDHREDPQSNSQNTDDDLSINEGDDDLLLVSENEKQDPEGSRRKGKENLNDQNEGNDDNDLSSSRTHKKDQTSIGAQTQNEQTEIKTSDLLDLLPRRRHVVNENKRKKNVLKREDGHKVKPRKSKKGRINKKQTKGKTNANDDLEEVTGRELIDRIRHFEEIDQYSLPVEEA